MTKFHMKAPDFIIAGTQKAGTTWLRRNLFLHPQITGPKQQLHFFDKNYKKGLTWYFKNFSTKEAGLIDGEKTTEYFDIQTSQKVSQRIAEDCPDTKIIIILRDPVKRAFSALRHMVNSGLEPLPSDVEKTLFDDRRRPKHKTFDYIERGFYAQQLEYFYRHIAANQILLLIFEEDIVSNPQAGISKTLRFLGASETELELNTSPINELRLSKPSIHLSRILYNVPYARGLIRRVDRRIPLSRWKPYLSDSLYESLNQVFAQENKRLFDILGREIPEWKMK